MRFRIEFFPSGQTSIHDHLANQAMHSSIGPWKEAQTLYIEQSQLLMNLQTQDAPLVLFDVGLGMATNALCAVEVFLNHRTQRDLSIYSFENEINGILFAIQNVRYFAFLEPYFELLNELLSGKTVIRRNQSGHQLNWKLVQGNFLNTLEAAVLDTTTSISAPEIIFYDFYSPTVCPELWGYHCFSLLHRFIKNSCYSELWINFVYLQFIYFSSICINFGGVLCWLWNINS